MWTRSTILHQSMKNADNPAKPVREFLAVRDVVFMRECHEVGMSLRVERVLCASEIVCRIVHSEDLVLVNSVVYNDETISFLRCEAVLIAVKVASK